VTARRRIELCIQERRERRERAGAFAGLADAVRRPWRNLLRGACHSSGNWADIPQNVVAQCQNRIVRKLMRTEVSLPQIR